MGHFTGFFFLLTKGMSSPKAQFAHFSKWPQIVERDLLRSSAKSQTLLRELNSISSPEASSSTSDDRPGLGSFVNDLSPDRNSENQPQT